jgi:NAD(P)-dependent dehydrogenase (short-subunit alcohol dehydrogenase family)
MTTSPHTQSMLPADTFKDRTIVVTGGGTGLGRSMGHYFLELGANLAICGRRKQVVEQAAVEMAKATGGQVFAQPCDVREPDQVDSFLDAAAERFGTIHSLVNNAAGNFVCPTERLSYNAINTVVDIVLKGTYNCTLAVGKRWIPLPARRPSRAHMPPIPLLLDDAHTWTLRQNAAFFYLCPVESEP